MLLKQCVQCAKCMETHVKCFFCNDGDKTLKLSACLIASKQTLIMLTDSKNEGLANI